MKVFMQPIRFIRVLIFFIITIFILVFFVFQSTRTTLIIYDIGLYFTLLSVFFMATVLFSFYKARIEIDEKKIYCPCYPWFEDFKVDSNEAPMFKTILYTNIDSINLIDVTGVDEKTVKAIFLKIKNKYDIIVLLDGYSIEKQQEILCCLTQKSSLI